MSSLYLHNFLLQLQLLVAEELLATDNNFINVERFADENQIESTAKFQLFIRHRKKTFFHKTNAFSEYRRRARKKQAHSKLCISLRVCRAL